MEDKRSKIKNQSINLINYIKSITSDLSYIEEHSFIFDNSVMNEEKEQITQELVTFISQLESLNNEFNTTILPILIKSTPSDI